MAAILSRPQCLKMRFGRIAQLSWCRITLWLIHIDLLDYMQVIFVATPHLTMLSSENSGASLQRTPCTSTGGLNMVSGLTFCETAGICIILGSREYMCI